MNTTNSILNEVVLYSEYQPIVYSNTQSTFAYEALMRNSNQISPLVLIKSARNKGELYELDTKCIKNAIIGFPTSYLKKYYLFVNIFPSTIVHNDFENFIYNLVEYFPWITKSVVFEINEDSLDEYIWNQPIFLKGLTLLKSLGFKIAFDDIALTKISLRRLEFLRPNFVKLDYTHSKNLSNSKKNQQLISYFLEFTNDDVQLILEGIESKEDLYTAQQLGVTLLQGYYFAKPGPLNKL